MVTGFRHWFSYGPITVTPSGGGDPTPSITSVTSDPSPPWQAGSTYPFWVDGTGFGTNPNVTISQNGATYFNGLCGGSQCDTHFAGWVTIPSDAPDGDATVTVTSNGYNGLGWGQNPSGGSNIATAHASVIALQYVCGAPRDYIIAEYAQNGASWTPGCDDFTSDGHSAHFSFAALKSPDADWAILTSGLLNGLEAIRVAWGSDITINSGYRTPAHNAQIGGAANSRHIYGDAADMAVGADSTWDALRPIAKENGACVEPRNMTPSWMHVDWRGACPGGW